MTSATLTSIPSPGLFLPGGSDNPLLWTCTLCATTVNVFALSDHAASRSHLARVAAEEKRKVGMVEDKWFCEICDADVAVGDKEEHLASWRHLVNVREAETAKEEEEDLLVFDYVGRGVKRMTFYCLTCKSEFPRGEQGKHLSGAMCRVPVVDEWMMEEVDEQEEEEHESGGEAENRKEEDDAESPIANSIPNPQPPEPTFLCATCDRSFPISVQLLHLSHWRCPVCCLVMHKHEKDSHIATLGHPPSAASDDWHCDVCNRTYKLGAKTGHENGKKHLTRLQSIKDTVSTKKAAPTVYCNTKLPKEPAIRLDAPRETPETGVGEATFVYPTSSKIANEATTNNNWYCELCSRTVSLIGREGHENGGTHRSKVAERAKMAAATVKALKGKQLPNTFLCLTCNHITPLNERSQHLSPAWHCDVCNQYLHLDWKGAHLERHQVRDEVGPERQKQARCKVEPVEAVKEEHSVRVQHQQLSSGRGTINTPLSTPVRNINGASADDEVARNGIVSLLVDPNVLGVGASPNFHCELCKMTINLVDKAAHLASLDHWTNLTSAAFRTSDLKKSPPAPPPPTRITKVDPSTPLPSHPILIGTSNVTLSPPATLCAFVCTLCHLTMSLSNKASHLGGKKHQEALRAAEDSKVQESAYCGFCKTPVSEAVELHLASDAHRTAMQSAVPGGQAVNGNGGGTQETFRCEVCAQSFFFADRERHLQGAMHAEAVRFKKAAEDMMGTIAAGNKASKPGAPSRTHYCSFCNVDMANEVEMHMASMPHKRAVRKAKVAALSPIKGQPPPAVSNPTATASTSTPPVAPSKLPSSATYFCHICSRNVLASCREEHFSGPIHAQALNAAHRKARWKARSAAQEDRMRQSKALALAAPAPMQPKGPSALTFLCDVCNESKSVVGRAGHENSNKHKKNVLAREQALKATGVQARTETGSNGTAPGGKEVEAILVQSGVKSVPAKEDLIDVKSTTTAEGQPHPQLRDLAQPDAFTLQSQSSTARLYCDACERQLNTVTGFAAHMKGKKHRTLMEAKIATKQKQPHVASEASTSSAAAPDIPNLPVMEPAQQIQSLPTIQDTVNLEQFPQAPGMQPIVADNCRPRLVKPAVPDELAGMYYCSPCHKFLCVNRHEEHLVSQSHLTKLIPKDERLSYDVGPAAHPTLQTSPATAPQHRAPEEPSPALPAATTPQHRAPEESSSALSAATTPQNRVPEESSPALPAATTPQNRVPEESSPALPAATTPQHRAPEESSLALLAATTPQHRVSEESSPALPAPLTIPADSFHCATCNCTRKLIDYHSHMSSMPHQRLLGQQAKLKSYTAPPSILAPDPRPEPWFCIICEVYCHIDSKESHLASKPHIKKARDVPSAEQGPAATINPTSAQGETLGSQSCMHEEELQHMGSRPTGTTLYSEEVLATFHCTVCDRDFKVQVQEQHNSPGWYCSVCETSSHEEQELHLKGTAHLAQLAKKRIQDDELFYCHVCEKECKLSLRNWHRSEGWFCEACNIMIHQHWKETHVVDFDHIKREKQKGTISEAARAARSVDEMWFCDVCGKEIKVKLRRWHSSPGWHCDVCETLVHEDWRDDHIQRAVHVKRQTEKTATAARTDSYANEPDLLYCTSCDMRPKDMAKHVLTKEHRIKVPDYEPPEGKMFCELCKGEYPPKQGFLHRSALWECDVCAIRMHEISREGHLNGAKHAKRKALKEKIETSDRATTAKSEHNEEPESESGQTDSYANDTGGEAALDRLNQIVHDRALGDKSPANPEVSIATGADPDIWKCTLCDIEMPSPMRKGHEARSLHTSRQERKRQEKDCVTEHGTSVLPVEPANPRAESFRCLVCITTYGPDDRHLHSTPPWHCEACDTVLHTSAKSDHLSSVSHRLKESSPKEKDTKSTFIPASKDTFFCLPCRGNILKSERRFHYSPAYHCALCELTMHADTRDIHEWSLSHSQSVKAATARPANRTAMFSCQTCKKAFPVAVQAFHRSRAWTCELCEVTVHMDWIGAHLMSDGHVARTKDDEGKGEESGGGQDWEL